MEYSLRRKARKIEDAEAVEVLRRCDWGVLSLAGSDGMPYGVPLNYVLQDTGDRLRLIFHCAREGRKIECLKSRPHGAFVVVEDPRILPDKFSTAYASAMVSGRVAIVDDPDAKRELLKFFVQKLAPDFLERGDRHIEHRLHECLVLQMEIESLCGKGRKWEEPYALAHLGF
ncbi:MAG: pyridoxamine 5'-phosphate oxidase family protein [Desulfovibrionales bacterium]|nr:pyridoxamine 5'-phosphate oxidase family protein [Desulfovibrionales bacterium]